MTQFLISSDGQNNSGDAEWSEGGPGLNSEGTPLCFIFRPDADDPLSTNVFRTWGETVAALNAADDVPKEFCLDSSQLPGSYADAMTIPAGTYDFSEVTGMRSAYQGNNATQLDPVPAFVGDANRVRQRVNLEPGVSFTTAPAVLGNAQTLYIRNLRLVIDNTSTVPVFDIPDGDSLVVILENCSIATSGSSPVSPFFRLGTGSFLQLVLRDSVVVGGMVGIGTDAFVQLHSRGQSQVLTGALFSETGGEWGLLHVVADDAVDIGVQVDEDLLSSGSTSFGPDADTTTRARRRGVERSLLHRSQLSSTTGFGASLAVLQAAMLTYTANPAVDETLVIEDGDGAGTETYTFKSPAVGPFEIDIGANTNETAINIAAAINSDSLLWAAAPCANGEGYGDLGAVGVVIRRASQGKPHYADRLHGSMSAKVFRWTKANNYTEGRAFGLPATDPGAGIRDFGYGAVLTEGFSGDSTGMAFQSAVDGKVYFTGPFPVSAGKPAPGVWNAVVGPADEEVIVSSGGGTPPAIIIGVTSGISLNGIRIITVSVTGGTDQTIRPPLFQNVFEGARYTIRRVDTDETSTLRLEGNGGIPIEGVGAPFDIIIPPGGEITIERRAGAAEWTTLSPVYNGDATNTTWVTERTAVQKTLTLAPGATGTTVLDSLTKAVVIDATGAGPYDIDLPPIVHWPPGVPFFLARTDAAADVLTISTLDGSLIDGAASATIGGGAAEAVTLINNQVGWFVVGRTP
jgi:hypothetical protein